MMVKAYELLLKIPQDKLSVCLEKFNQIALEVCEGQQLDMDFEVLGNVSIDEYLEMIRLKTAVLLGFSLSLGARLGGASEKDVEALKQFGDTIGVGFQLQDDLLDAFGHQAEVGKTIGGDIMQNKKTFLFLKTLELANENQKKEIDKWLAIHDRPEAKVRAIKQIMSDLGIESEAKKLMNFYFEKAFEKLENLSVEKSKIEFLKQFSYSFIERSF